MESGESSESRESSALLLVEGYRKLIWETVLLSCEPRLYKRVCPSVGRSVHPSVGRSVGRSVGP